MQPETADAAGVLTIDGTSGDDDLVVTTTGADVGTYSLNGGPVVPFTGLMSLTFNGGAGNDLVTVHNPDGGLFAPSGGIFVNGGAQSGDPGDGLAIVGGAIDTASFTTAGNHADGKDGTIVLTHGAVTATYTYTGLEPLANTGTAANIVFTLPAGADTVVIEDDGTPGNNISRIRSVNNTFETTTFTHPTGSLTINSGTGDTITINLKDSFNGASLTVGSLTNAAVNPDSIAINSVETTGTVTLAATGAISESGSDVDADITAGLMALSAGTGIGTSGNHLETAGGIGIGVGSLEAQTTTGGIFIDNTGSLTIGGVTSALTGLKVVTSGDINLTNTATLTLADADGPEIVRGGSTSGDVTLHNQTSISDFKVTANNDAITAPAGNIDVRAGRDISFGTAGANFDNDVRASGFVFIRGEGDVVVDGLSNITADDFGQNTAGSVNMQAGGNISLANAHGNGASIAANGTAGGAVLFTAGPNGLFSLSAPNPVNSAAVFSSSGNIAVNANRVAIASGSGMTAAAADHFVLIQPVSTSGWAINLGSATDTAASTLELSDAELDRITASILRIGEIANPGSITVSSPITANGHYDTLSLRTGGAIIDGTATEQADLTVNKLALRTGHEIGGANGVGAAGDLDVAVSTLAFSAAGGAGDTGIVNVSNTGALTLGAVDGLTASSNLGTFSFATATGALTVAANLTSKGDIFLTTIDSAGAGQNVTVQSGVTVKSTNGNMRLQAADDLNLQAGSTVQVAGTITGIVDFGNADPGVGGTANLDGSAIVSPFGIFGDVDADTYNVTPSASTEISLLGLDPATLPGDSLNLNLSGTTNALLSFSSVAGNSKNGSFTFGNRQPVDFFGIETLNSANGALTVNGTAGDDTLTVHSTSPTAGSFTLASHQVIDTIATWNGSSSISPFGVVPSTATYGEVITTDLAHSTLTSFTFEMNLPATVALRGEVYAWDGTKATGPALFESAPVSTGGAGFQAVTFNAGGLLLDPGQQYVLFASTSKDQAGHSGSGSWGELTSDAYSGGQFVFLNNGADPAQWTTAAWTSFGANDLAFRAEFDTTATASFSNLTSFRFDGLDGRDTLVGGAGDDTLIGGPSNDIAVFSGPRSAYRFTLNLDHSLEVADLRPGHPDGVDTLSSIERLQFSDATYLVDSLFSTAFHPVGGWTSAGLAVEGDRWYTGDFNGDHKDDIFRYAPGISGADMFLSSGSSFTGVGSWTGAGLAVAGDRWYTGDFNGDGKDDIFRYAPGISGADMFLSNGSGFGGVGSWTGAGLAVAGDRWYTGDFNGDGRDDIFRYAPGISGADMFLSNGSGFASVGSWTGAGLAVVGDRWYVGDFNGDGKDDIFRYAPGISGADMFLSNGSGFVNVGSWTSAGLAVDGDRWYVADFNGDGRDDIMRYAPGVSGAEVSLSNGSGFLPGQSWTSAGLAVVGDHWYTGDFNGNGAADIFRYAPGISGADMFLA